MTPQDHATASAMFAHGGNFVRRLGQAALAADANNLARLKAAFPEYWERYTAHAAHTAQESATPSGRMRYCDTDEGAKQTAIYLNLK